MASLRRSTTLAAGLLALTRLSLAQDPRSAASPPPPPAVWVHIDGPPGVELQTDLDSMHAAHDWQTVCAAPCDRYLSSDSRYRLTGGGRKSSDEFALEAPDGGRERIGVSGGSKAWFILGWVGIGAGAVSAGIGLELLIIPLTEQYVPGADGRTSSRSVSGYPVLGWSLLGAGVTLALASTSLMLDHRRTTVTQDVPPAPPPAPASGRDGDEPRPRREAELPRATFVPLVSGVF